MIIKVLGPGCPGCVTLERVTRSAQVHAILAELAS